MIERGMSGAGIDHPHPVPPPKTGEGTLVARTILPIDEPSFDFVRTQQSAAVATGRCVGSLSQFWERDWVRVTKLVPLKQLIRDG